MGWERFLSDNDNFRMFFSLRDLPVFDYDGGYVIHNFRLLSILIHGSFLAAFLGVIFIRWDCFYWIMLSFDPSDVLF